MILDTTLPELCRKLESAHAAEEFNCVNGIDAIVVQDSACDFIQSRSPQCPVITQTYSENLHPLIDVLATENDSFDAVIHGIENSPVAAQVLVQLLRHNEESSIEEALFAESMAYSVLQHGERFEQWLGTHTRKSRKDRPEDPPILYSRVDSHLTLTLNRPDKRNAWSLEMRDALTEALQLTEADPSIKEITINANGPAFGAGGDLDEFGEARDAALSHLTRSIRNPALLLSQQQQKTTVELHGACVGAGIEIPAFAGRILAKPDTFCLLPEVAFGLIPGAGGTVSILRRIGRRRLALMAIAGQRIYADEALEWGLIDKIVS